MRSGSSIHLKYVQIVFRKRGGKMNWDDRGWDLAKTLEDTISCATCKHKLEWYKAVRMPHWEDRWVIIAGNCETKITRYEYPTCPRYVRKRDQKYAPFFWRPNTQSEQEWENLKKEHPDIRDIYDD
jgi:hypothetical protein